MRHTEKTVKSLAEPAAQGQIPSGHSTPVSGINSSPRMVAQRQQLRKLFGDAAQLQAGLEQEKRDPHAMTQGEPIQREIDTGKLNVVSESHRDYGKSARLAEKRQVTSIFGEGTYHVEDTFSAMPDIAQEGGSAEEKDNLQTFASKADPPYYAITQGLNFIIQWCTEFRGYSVDQDKLNLITAAHNRIETEIISEPLKKLEGTEEEKDFVLLHDTLLARIEQIEEDETGGGRRGILSGNITRAVADLKRASELYLAKIQSEYAKARGEFEQFMGIEPGDAIVKKRSVTMGFHALAHALLGNKGVLKVGEYHLADFKHMDLGDVTLSENAELKEFLRQRAQTGVPLLKSADQAQGAGLNETAPLQQMSDSNELPDNLKAGIETLSGYSMDDVKVHYNSSHPAQLNALAYAQGTHIHVAPGQEKHLPHEAWHVVQQKQGRVQPTLQAMGSVNINDDRGLEEEADAMGQRAAQLTRSVAGSLKDEIVSRVAIQRMPNRDQPVQLLSDFEPLEWKSQFEERAELAAFHDFEGIVAAAAKWDGDADDENLAALKLRIKQLGNTLLSTDDVGNVYAAIGKFFPAEYLSMEDVRKVKTYNFDGPVSFTAENVMAWLRLARGAGTVDDLRYIHHEIYEIKKIQGTEFEPDLAKTEENERFWAEAYPPAHGAALMVEIRFLMHLVNRVYKKNYTWEQVAASDIERREDFLGTLYGKGKVPLGEDYLPDMKRVQKDFGKFIDPELSGLLTAVKKKKLPR